MGQSIVRALNQNVTGFKREHYSASYRRSYFPQIWVIFGPPLSCNTSFILRIAGPTGQGEPAHGDADMGATVRRGGGVGGHGLHLRPRCLRQALRRHGQGRWGRERQPGGGGNHGIRQGPRSRQVRAATQLTRHTTPAIKEKGRASNYEKR